MRTQTENFVSEIILSPTFNPNTEGDVEAPSGYFGYMSFGVNEFTVDGMDTPAEFLGCTVVALVDSYGNIEYTELSEEHAVEWYVAQVNDFAEWYM